MTKNLKGSDILKNIEKVEGGQEELIRKIKKTMKTCVREFKNILIKNQN